MMITRKDLKDYSQSEIYRQLSLIIQAGCHYWQQSRPNDLMNMLIEEDPDRLMQIIRGYARYGKK